MTENNLQLVIQDEALLKAVTFNYDELKTELDNRLKKYKELVVTEDAINAAKTDRANLNKLESGLKDKQKEIQQKLLGGFDTKLKELRGMVVTASDSIDMQVKRFEQIEKDNKRHEIEVIYFENIGDLDVLVPFDRLFDDKWLNKGSSIKKITEELTAKINQVRNDLTVIDSLKVDSQILTSVKDFYLRTLDLSGALAEKARLEKAKADQEAFRVKQEAEKIARSQAVEPKPANVPVRSVEQPEEEEPKQYDFRVWATREQVSQLKEFLLNNKIKFGKVE